MKIKGKDIGGQLDELCDSISNRLEIELEKKLEIELGEIEMIKIQLEKRYKQAKDFLSTFANSKK